MSIYAETATSNSVTSWLRSHKYYPRPSTRTKRYCSFIQYGLSHYQHKILHWLLFYHMNCFHLIVLFIVILLHITVLFNYSAILLQARQ